MIAFRVSISSPINRWLLCGFFYALSINWELQTYSGKRIWLESEKSVWNFYLWQLFWHQWKHENLHIINENVLKTLVDNNYQGYFLESWKENNRELEIRKENIRDLMIQFKRVTFWLIAILKESGEKTDETLSN